MDGKYEDKSWSGGKSLKDEMEEWGGTIPSADELEAILFDPSRPPIPWDRIGFFQDVSVRLIAERLLPQNLHGSTYLQVSVGSTGSTGSDSRLHGSTLLAG